MICDIILVKGQSKVSILIEQITDSEYSHTAGIVGENEIIEAGMFKVQYQTLDYYSGQYDIYRCDSLTDEQRLKIVEYVKNQLNKHYDYLLLIWEFLRYTFGLILPYYNTNDVICSELWANAYRSVGIDLCPDIIKYPSPKDLSESKLLRKIEN